MSLGETLRAHSDNRAVYWWQSRYNMRNPPQLADLEALAKSIRRSFK